MGLAWFGLVSLHGQSYSCETCTLCRLFFSLSLFLARSTSHLDARRFFLLLSSSTNLFMDFPFCNWFPRAHSEFECVCSVCAWIRMFVRDVFFFSLLAWHEGVNYNNNNIKKTNSYRIAAHILLQKNKMQTSLLAIKIGTYAQSNNKCEKTNRFEK